MSDLASIAARGLSEPESLTPDEIQSLAGRVLGSHTMSEETRAELIARRAELKRKADKRRNMPGFAANVAEIDAWIAEIDAELSAT